MLPRFPVWQRSLSTTANVQNYRSLLGDDLIEEILALARDLNGVRVCHINSTAFGGGVAELLSRLLPLLSALGITAEWRFLFGGHPEFFTVTKALHNALQGSRYDLEDAQRALYLRVNEESAKSLEPEYDVYVVHDPQPAAIRHFAGARGGKWIWRCHIDTSEPDPAASRFLHRYIEEYDALIYSMPDFLLPELGDKRVAVVPPAIDPLATKNMDLPEDICRRAMSDFGVDLGRPVLLQVSRFDPWKDPLGVIRAYRLVKEQFPGVQLCLIGAMAADDPEGWELLGKVEEESADDHDLFVFTNLTGVGNMEVNVFQRGCDVVIQKSIREGFGLVVSEALWKEKPVVAGRAGGIPSQFPDGFTQYLVRTSEECADRIIYLLQHPGERGTFGRAGREHVRRAFLLPRLLRDELKLVKELL